MRVNLAGDETKTELDAGELEQRQSELDAGALEQRRMPSTPDGEPVFSHRSRASRSSSSSINVNHEAGQLDDMEDEDAWRLDEEANKAKMHELQSAMQVRYRARRERVRRARAEGPLTLRAGPGAGGRE